MNKTIWIIVVIVILGGLGFYFWNSGTLPGVSNSGANLQPPALPE